MVNVAVGGDHVLGILKPIQFVGGLPIYWRLSFSELVVLVEKVPNFLGVRSHGGQVESL